MKDEFWRTSGIFLYFSVLKYTKVKNPFDLLKLLRLSKAENLVTLGRASLSTKTLILYWQIKMAIGQISL
jgi:hypothetical protein